MLDKNFGNYETSLMLNDDSTFEIRGTSSYAAGYCLQEEVYTIAWGQYHINGDHVFLFDSLWGRKITLKAENGNYKAIAGSRPFINRIFKFDGVFSYKPDTASFSAYAFAYCTQEREANNTILRSKERKRSPAFDGGAYDNPRSALELLRSKKYALTFGTDTISSGRWRQKGDYLVFDDDHDHKSYVMKRDEYNRLVVIYFPFLYGSEMFFAKYP